jgi:hypothetical protein
MIERGGQRIRAAAVAHVHADHVEARIPGARGNALNVARVREPSSPCTSTRVSRPALSGSACQWQWQSTRLPSAGSTSTVSATPLTRKGGRGR